MNFFPQSNNNIKQIQNQRLIQKIAMLYWLIGLSKFIIDSDLKARLYSKKFGYKVYIYQ